ncbi:hypothetical protein [Chondromyces crocatus]|uniref:Uncharacterized protein n=1 Tax=Chondromyces crocatus TaxID=52 RepID=A0A0K1EJG5_CHOCO|nr:hypothetical protein [Chondromyces crocatus]AKT40817.1 uncharacterized protein CMC5_049720 [Chondromyces crocatus]
MAGEHAADDLPLHAFAAAVNDPHLVEPAGLGLGQVLLHYRGDVARRKRVQIDGILDRHDGDGVGIERRLVVLVQGRFALVSGFPTIPPA